jgi:hypothetical protein
VELGVLAWVRSLESEHNAVSIATGEDQRGVRRAGVGRGAYDEQMWNGLLGRLT